MKVTVEYDLNKAEDALAYHQSKRAPHVFRFVENVRLRLRSAYKHGVDANMTLEDFYAVYLDMSEETGMLWDFDDPPENAL